MKMLIKLFCSGLIMAAISFTLYSCGKPATTIDIKELKEIRKSEGLQRVLISNNIRCISADDKNIWVATDRGVSRFERITKKWIHYTQEDGLNSDNINAVASDGDLVWFGTDEGVNQYNMVTEKWRTFREQDGLKGRKVFRIAVDVDYVWFGTDQGINRYDRNIDSWAARTSNDGLSHPIVSALAVDDKYVWIGTHQQVNRYSKLTDSWNIYSSRDGLVDDFVTTIAVTDEHTWFGTHRAGISVYNKTNQTFMKPYTKADVLATNDIRSIAIDGNNIWIGTANAGVHRYLEVVDTWVRYTIDDGLASNHISWITPYKNEIWLGTYDSGVSLYDKASNRWLTFIKADSPPEDDVKDIVKSSSGKFWLATPGGLMKYDPALQEWTRYGKKDGLSTDCINDLNMDGNFLWIGTARGLASYNESSSQWRLYNSSSGLTEEFIKFLLLSNEGDSGKNLWIGTNNGLFHSNLDTRSLIAEFKPMAELEGHTITALIQKDNHLWIGTDKGLWKYDVPTGERFLYTSDHGLIHNHINSALLHEDRLYLGTRAGISIYDISTGGWQSMSEGLPGHSVRALLNSPNEDIIWIATTGGLAEFSVETGQIKTTMPDQNITSIAQFTDETLWLGTTSGVMEYDISSGDYREHRAFATRQPFKEASVANIVFDDDKIWFSNWSSSHNGAIVCYNRQKETWRRFTREIILGDTGAKSPTIIKWICADDKWVWFATDYGVLQYHKLDDTWQHFTTRHGLLSDNIRRIESTDSAVWVCPEMRTRINKYDKETGIWSEVRISRLIHPRNYIYDMVADSDAVWVSISSSGVRRITEDGQQEVFMKEEGLAQMGARHLNIDSDYVWVAHWKDRGTGTLSRYDKKNGKWNVYSISDVLEADMISRIVTGKEYTWIIYEAWQQGSVTGYNRKTGEWTTVRLAGGWGSQIMEVCEDEGYLWLAPGHGGIKRFHMASGTWTSFYSGGGPTMDFVNQRAMKADKDYLWIGTPAGVSRYDKKREIWANYTEIHNLAGESVQAVVSDERYVWCGTSQGISRYDKTYGTWLNLSSKRSNALAVDDKFLWVATSGGSARYDKMADRWDMYGKWNNLPGMDVSCIVVDGYDIWMGTDGGMGKFPKMSDDPNAWLRYTSGLEIKAGAMTREYASTLVSNKVWSVDADRRYIWVGTMRGVSRYNKGTDTWTTYTTENGLASDEISSICVDGNVVWFGSDSGVTMYDKNSDKWTTYTAEDGLASKRITCIARSSDAIWFGTFDSGLMKYDKKSVIWQTYTRKDGLAHDCVLSISVDGKLIWIGTRRGLNRYDTNENSWTTFTQYGDSEDEMDALAFQAEEQMIQDTQPAQISLKIVEIEANPPGPDEENLNGEWVKIANAGDSTVDMDAFTLSDYAGHEYRFKKVLIPSNSTITVFTGAGTDTATSLYWGSKSPVWNNRGDTGYLKDANGNIVDIYSY